MDEAPEVLVRKGSVVKQEKGPFGQQIRRVLWPTLGETVISERFPDSYRSISLYSVEQLHGGTSHGYATFSDKERGSNTKVEALLGDQLQVIASPLDPWPEGWGAGFQLAYNNEEQLKNCALQAESVQLPRAEEPKPWIENIKALVNLAKTASGDAFLGIDGWVDTSRRHTQDRYGWSDDQIDKIVERGKRNLHKFMEPHIDPEDIPILDDLRLFEQLVCRLLDNPNEELNKLLDDLVGTWVNFGSSAKNYQRSLVLTKIEEQAFDWQEVDTEFGLMSEGIKVLREGKQSYGVGIPIEGNKFIVTRDGDKLSITCKTQRGDVRWTGKFPISISSNHIIGILNDPNQDFRKIKDLLGVELSFS